jgi:hypothetical protein
MKLITVLGVFVVFVYVEAASVQIEGSVEDSPVRTLILEPAKVETSADELTRQKRQFGFGGFGFPGVGFGYPGGYAPGFGYGGYGGYGHGHGGYGGYGENLSIFVN